MPRRIASKSPRVRVWPPRYDNGVMVPEIRELVEDIRLCEGLVQMFNELVDLDLKIKWNNNEQGVEAFITETGEINVPKMHPNRKELVKHEISHPAFGSDFDKIRAFLDFMENYLDPFGRLPSSTKQLLREDISLIHNIFEDERVNSCWAEVFPGDGRALEDWSKGEIGPELYRKSMKEYKNGDIDNVALYIVLTILRQPAKSLKWQKYKQEILTAAEDVKRTNFDYCLTRVRDLICKIAKDKLDDLDKNDPNQQNNSQSASNSKGKSNNPFTKDNATDAVNSLVNQPKRAKPDKIKSENSGMTYKRTANTGKASDEAKDEVKKLMALNDAGKASLKREGKQKLQEFVMKTMEASDNIEVSGSRNEKTIGTTMEKLESRFNVHTVTSGDTPEITSKIRLSAAKLKNEFDKIKSKKKRTMEFSGSRLDIGTVIRNKVGKVNLPYYDYWKKSKGYEMVVILDCSSSMRRSQEDLETLFSTLRLALKGLKEITLTVYGFSQKQAGYTEIFLWKNTPYIFGGELKISGTTPMAQAIAFVKEVITRDKSRKKSVLFIGDGYPVFNSSRGSVSTENLTWWVRQEIEDLQKSGIRTYGLMIGSDIPSEEEMSRMFLNNKNWTQLKRENLLKDTISFISREFMKELK